MAGSITNIGGNQQIWNLGNNMINVGDLVKLEMQTLEMKKSPYLSQKQQLTDEKNIYASMKKEFNSFMQVFKDFTKFTGNEKATTVSKDGFLTAKAEGKAIPGTYEITVSQIAQRHQITTDSTKKINLDDKINKDASFTIGGEKVEVTKDMTYKDLINKINNGGYGVSAYSLGGQIFLTSTTAGKGGQIQLIDGSEGLLKEMGFVKDDGTTVAHEITAATNAKYTINGVEEEGNSNKIDSLPGVTINLEKVTTEPIKLTVQESDVKESIDLIKRMKDEYNKAVSTLDLFAGENGVMQGSTVSFTIRNAMTSMFTYSKDKDFLSTFGIQVDKTGIMTLDEEKLTNAFKEDPEKAKQFFFGFNGIGYDMEKKLEKIFGDEGIIGERSKSIESQVRKLDDKINDIDKLNKQRQGDIIDKYSKLESELAFLDMQLKTIKAMTGQKKED
ncbi:flagellar capping protein [Bacillus manliponensis]|uniref:Flagellar hook-associated protein 2 n=1 Tax=Bacillus manliponensis TaxID=574376 RepID=A0A073JZY6_9BACI|nr:flagellar hook-associated protein 2 [Bacillus manliponensis]KEK20629.1 flagellar capping protein [Bacillus manliponensis]